MQAIRNISALVSLEEFCVDDDCHGEGGYLGKIDFSSILLPYIGVPQVICSKKPEKVLD